MIRHHPSEATLLACASGTLPEPHARVVAAHLGFCPDCVRALGQAEAVGGALLADLPPSPLAGDALARTLARLDAPAPDAPGRVAPQGTVPGWGAPRWDAPGWDAPGRDAPGWIAPGARPATLAALATGRWRWTGPGIAIMPLIPRDASDSRLDLIRVAPGVALLEHGHTGRESTCVMQGAFQDATGAYHTGDFIETDRDLAHRPTALPGETCLCLIATSGHLQPRGILGWLVRPLLGM